MEVSLLERSYAGRLLRGGLLIRGAMVPQDRRVDPVREVRFYCIVGLSADPVVANRLLGVELRRTVSEGGGRPCYRHTHDERVPLCDEDLQRIRDHRVHVLAVGLDDRHVVSIDGEKESVSS